MTPEEEGFQRHLSSEAVISKVVGAIVKQVDAADGNKLGLVINGASAAGNGEHGSFSSAAAESTAKIMEDLRWIIMNYNETRRVGPNSWQGFLFGWFVGGVLKRAVNEVTTTPVYTNFLENESQISRHSFLMQLMLKSSTVKSILEMATHIILSDRMHASAFTMTLIHDPSFINMRWLILCFIVSIPHLILPELHKSANSAFHSFGNDVMSLVPSEILSSRHRIIIKNPDSLAGLLVECLGFVHEQSPVSFVLSLVELCERYHNFLVNGSSFPGNSYSDDPHLLAYIFSIMSISTPVFDALCSIFISGRFDVSIIANLCVVECLEHKSVILQAGEKTPVPLSTKWFTWVNYWLHLISSSSPDRLAETCLVLDNLFDSLWSSFTSLAPEHEYPNQVRALILKWCWRCLNYSYELLMGNLMDKGSMAVLNPTSPEYSKLLAGISANIPNILNRIISRLRSGSNSSNSPTCIPDVDILQIVDLEQCGLRHRIFHCFLLLEVAGVHMGQDCAQKILVYFIENYDVYENSSSDVLGFMNYKASSSGSVFVDIIVRLRTCFQYYPSLFSEAIKSIMDDISGYIIEVKSGQEPSSSFSPIKLYNILTNLHSLCCYDISSLPVSSYSYSRKLLPRLLLPYWDRLYDISLLKIGKDESISVDLHAVSLDLCSSIIEFEASVSVRIETRPVLRRALSMKELSCSPKDDCLLSNTSLCGSIGLRSVAAFYIVVRTSAEVDENKIRGVVLSNYTPDSSSSSLAPPSDPMSDKEVNGNLISSFSSQERALRSRRMVKSTKSMIANLSLFPQTFFMLFDALLEYSYLSLPSLRTIATQSSGGNYSSVSNKVNGGDTLMPSTNVEDALCLLHSVKPVVEGGSKETGASIHFSSQVANNSLFKPKIEKAELTRRNVKRVETQRLHEKMRFHIGSLVQEMLSGLDLPVQELIAFLLSGRLKCPHPILSKEEYKESMKLLKPSPRDEWVFNLFKSNRIWISIIDVICQDKKSFIESLIEPIIRPLHAYLVTYWFQKKWNPVNQYFSYSPHFKQPPKPSSDHAFEVELGRKIIEWLVNIDLIPWPLSNTALLFDHITGVSIGKIMWMSWNLYPHKDNAAVADSATNLEEEFETTKELETQKTELDLFQKCVFDVVLKEGSEISPYLTTLLIEEIKDQ